MNLVAHSTHTDNRIRILHDERHALVVHPGGPDFVARGLVARSRFLAGILVIRPAFQRSIGRSFPRLHRASTTRQRVSAATAAPPWKNPFR